MIAIIAIARRLEPAIRRAVVWLAPVILEPLSIVVTFQIGNIQLACIAGSLLAMVRRVTMRKTNSPMVIVKNRRHFVDWRHGA